MRATPLGRAHCDGCGKLRECLIVWAFAASYKICATCVHNACRWKPRNDRATVRALKAKRGVVSPLPEET